MTDDFIAFRHYDLDIEKGILGACILEPNSYGRIQGLLTIDCFYSTEHQEIYQGIAEMWRQNLPLDLFTIVSYMVRKGMKGKAISEIPYFITRVTEAVTSSAHLEYHGLLVREMFAERELMRIQRAPNNNKEDALTRIAKLQKELAELVAIKVSYDWSDMTDVIHRVMLHMEAVKDKDLIGLTTGFSEVDLMTGGLVPGTLTVIAARPSVGKSALLNTMALAQAEAGDEVGIVSLEMPKVQLGARMGAHYADTAFYKIFRNKLYDEAERKKVYDGLNRLSQLPIFISDKTGVNIEDIKAKAAQLIYKKKLKKLYIDYLQLVESQGTNKQYNREQEVSKISRGCKLLAMDFNIPVTILAQLNRQSESASDRKPQLHHLRESGAIEQDADGVLLLHRDWKVGITQDDNGNSTERQADLIVAKWRNGDTKAFKIGFDPEKMRFFDPAQDDRQSFQKAAGSGLWLPYADRDDPM